VQANACPALSSGNFIGAIDAGGSRSMKCVFDLIIDFVKIAAITVVTVDSRVCLRGGELGG